MNIYCTYTYIVCIFIKYIYTKIDQLSLDNEVTGNLYFIPFTHLHLLRGTYIDLVIKKRSNKKVKTIKCQTSHNLLTKLNESCYHRASPLTSVLAPVQSHW